MIGESLAIAAAVCFSLGALFSRLGSDHLPSATGLLISLLSNAATLLLFGVAYVAFRGLPEFSAFGIGMFALAGVSGTLIGRWGAIQSGMILGPSRASLYKNLQPVITTALAVGFLGELFRPIDSVGASLILVGTVLVTRERAAGGVATDRRWQEKPGRRTEGILTGLVAAAGFAVGNTLRKVAVGVWPEPIFGAIVGVIIALIGFSIGGGGLRRADVLRSFGRGQLYFTLMGVSSAAAQLLFFSSLVLIPVWIANIFVSMEPIVTILLSAVLFRGRENLSPMTLLSAVLVVGGAVTIVAT
jgi:drug/metabolite transporter (DMT)-like permease